MNKKMTIWGRDFDIKVIFDVYSGEEVLNEQKEALDTFCSKADAIFSDATDIEKYCIKNNRKEVGDSITNIFKYVIPRSLFIKRDTKKHSVVLMCDYKFDEEHGIAMIFENEKLAHIGTQDDI